MDNQTSEEQAAYIVDTIINPVVPTTHYWPDGLSTEVQQLVISKLEQYGYKAEFQRLPGEPLTLIKSKIPENE